LTVAFSLWTISATRFLLVLKGFRLYLHIGIIALFRRKNAALLEGG
jgi:hypothetical protein